MPFEGLQLGHYRLLRPIGSGGMGEVYLAEDPRIHRQVAIKVIRGEARSYPGALASQEAARLFQREARAIAMLDHPHILPLYDYGEEIVDGILYTFLVMPFRQEGSLAAWLHQRGSSLYPEDAGYLVKQAASALQYAHDHLIIHQDVKPSNFLIRSNSDNPNRPDLLLTDFGVAKLSTATSSVSHSIRGTPTYMAPEQWSGEAVPATDQYALAVMTYEMLTGRPPFQGPPMRMMYLHTNEQPHLPSTLNPRIPPEVDTVLLKALAKNPQNRFASISTFAQVFQQALQIAEGPTLLKNPPTPVLPETVLRPSSGYIERTVPVLNSSGSSASAPTSIVRGTEVSSRHSGHGISRGKTLLLIVLILLIVLTSIGLFYLNGSKQATNNNNASVTATTQAKDTTVTAQAVATATILAQANTSATLIAGNPDPYPPYSGRLALYDPLKNNTTIYGWDTNPTTFGTCNFTGVAYRAIPKDNYYHICAAENTSFMNFTYEVKLNIIEGDCGGIIFRADTSKLSYYYFVICQDGSYQLSLYTGGGGSPKKTYKISSSSAINQGLNQQNTIAVVASGSILDFYVNSQHIDREIDSTYSKGQIGVAAQYNSNPTEVEFNDAKVWML